MTNDEEFAKRLEESTRRYEEAKKKFATAYSQKLLETPCARSTLLTCKQFIFLCFLQSIRNYVYI
jgi:hypothetical protein